MTDENERPRPEDDAARLGLVIVGEAAALQSGDDASLDASEENIRETVDSMVDEPLTPRQEEVVERLAAAGGTLTAGLSGALAAKTGGKVEDVLEGAARSVVWQQRLAAEREALQGQPQESADGGAVTEPRDDRRDDTREDAGAQQRRNDDGRDRG
ncbi:hypothetical protein [Curtobacterium oceanosedimentum]|uniref:hypothetical protein n=1 Tax=Curtobacterium oceanosedimentum TaxID=465820 RepID=UPI003390C479